MREKWTRRGFSGATAGAGLLLATGCGDDENKGGNPGDGPVTVTHAYGETTIPAKPTRVVSAGFTGQDDLLAVGAVPIAVTDWFGGEPFAVWPWAQSQLGPAQPVMLSLADSIQVPQIAGLNPDLIVATNAGLDRGTYDRLSEIAPTIAQSGQDAFWEPWKDQATTIGGAVYAADQMKTLIDGIDQSFTTAATEHPEFAGKRVLRLQGYFSGNNVVVTLPGWRTEFLTQMGLVVPQPASDYAQGAYAYVPRQELAAVLDEADVLIWETESDTDQAAVLADPNIIALKATRQNRHVFVDKELTGAMAFSSPLSMPVVSSRLPPMLAAALG
ncbi:MAG: ABC transporter substrate-binding protein [Mycobacterium sp.]